MRGYENGYTDDILDVLKEKQVPAVFFVTQPYAQSEPELIRRMIDEGHIVGNHSVKHPSFPECSAERCREEVMGLHEYIKETFDYEMTLFRFPMGEFSEMDLELLRQMGYRSVFWSFAYRDWLVDDQPDPQTALQTIVDKPTREPSICSMPSPKPMPRFWARPSTSCARRDIPSVLIRSKNRERPVLGTLLLVVLAAGNMTPA